MRIPRSTYRLQVSADFPLAEVADLVDYIADLGADWLYLSPLLVAEPGSQHGYDVVDHRRVDPERGGEAGLAAVVAAARERGLGVLVDIVPNHVGIATPRHNAWWWSVLKHGEGSEFAVSFDIDWSFGGGRVRIPVLGDDSLDALEVVGDTLRYYDNEYPLAPGTADDGADPVTVHGRQHYELVNWRRADDELNYRRFFGVNSLAGIRVEDRDVFDASHVEIARWFADGLVDGLRVDHPDGLRDPAGYLERLAGLTHEGYVLVEKILEGREQLPADWATAGTTGYDALADFDRVLVDPEGEAALSALVGVTDGPAEYAALIHATKRGIADGILRSEVLRLVRDLQDGGAPGLAEADPEVLADAIAELLTCFPVYRSYLPAGQAHLTAAATSAARHRPDLSAAIDVVLPVLSDPAHAAAQRFQQTSGMVMAKGVEDTAFYRFTRLTSLNEVGAEPAEFAVDVAEFHRRQASRQRDWPESMTTLSTHDTKRGEDTRARISVLAEVPTLWGEAFETLRALAPLDDVALESLLWQAIVGAWPASRERLHAYAEKAAREAGDSTGWLDPDEGFERAMHALVDATFDDPRVASIIDSVVGAVHDAGLSNGLSLKLLQLTAPGVPDVYQGSEFWERSLVDPDNRRPVDYAARRALLRTLDSGGLPAVDETGAAKLLVTSRALRLRRDSPELFTGYAPIVATGSAAGNALAFDRGGAVTAATRLPLGLRDGGGWGDTAIGLPYRSVIDVLTGRRFDGGSIPLAALLDTYPVALLRKES